MCTSRVVISFFCCRIYRNWIIMEMIIICEQTLWLSSVKHFFTIVLQHSMMHLGTSLIHFFCERMKRKPVRSERIRRRRTKKKRFNWEKCKHHNPWPTFMSSHYYEYSVLSNVIHHTIWVQVLKNVVLECFGIEISLKNLHSMMESKI